jgi:ECF transporter S component (folate family)
LIKNMARIRRTIGVKTLAILAMLAGLSVILERYLGINLSWLKVHFGYLPIAMAGMLFGVLPGIMVGVAADILSNLGTGFSWLFVSLAVIESAIYAILLRARKEGKKAVFIQALICQGAVSLFVYAGLNTWALWTIGFPPHPVRFSMILITYPVRVLTLYKMLEYRPVFEKYAK